MVGGIHIKIFEIHILKATTNVSNNCLSILCSVKGWLSYAFIERSLAVAWIVILFLRVLIELRARC